MAAPCANRGQAGLGMTQALLQGQTTQGSTTGKRTAQQRIVSIHTQWSGAAQGQDTARNFRGKHQLSKTQPYSSSLLYCRDHPEPARTPITCLHRMVSWGHTFLSSTAPRKGPFCCYPGSTSKQSSCSSTPSCRVCPPSRRPSSALTRLPLTPSCPGSARACLRCWGGREAMGYPGSNGDGEGRQPFPWRFGCCRKDG